jgi:predicted RNA-binding protein YlxR (DUF448 family)
MKKRSDKQALKPKHIPQRSCIACRSKRDKRDLIRVVCNDSGFIEIDKEKKMRGRGAYLCSNYGCWETALKRDRLQYALRTNIGPESKQHLLDFARMLAEMRENEP